MCVRKQVAVIINGIAGLIYPEGETIERISPRDIIATEDIVYNSDLQQIEIKGINRPPWIVNPADTGSMDPVIDHEHTALLVRLEAEWQKVLLVRGDIVIYELYGSNVMHRIIEIGEDEEGRWYRFQGDNNSRPDPYLIRNIHLKYVCIGVIY